jgi:hypothetical protein
MLPLVHLSTQASFLRAFPHVFAAIVLALAAYVSLVISFLVYYPSGSIYAAVAALIAMALTPARASMLELNLGPLGSLATRVWARV